MIPAGVCVNNTLALYGKRGATSILGKYLRRNFAHNPCIFSDSGYIKVTTNGM
jgi:hypothetical protein